MRFGIVARGYPESRRCRVSMLRNWSEDGWIVGVVRVGVVMVIFGMTRQIILADES